MPTTAATSTAADYPQLKDVTSWLKANGARHPRKIKDWAGSGYRRSMVEFVVACDKKASGSERQAQFDKLMDDLDAAHGGHVERTQDGAHYTFSWCRGDAYWSANVIVHCAIY